MNPVQYRGLGMKFNLLFVLFTFLAHRFLPKYDVRMQLLMFQIKMLRDRIDDQRIVPTPEERAELREAHEAASDHDTEEETR